MTRTRNKTILTVILSLLFSVSVFIGFGMMNKVSAEIEYWEEEYEDAMTTPYWHRDIIYNETALPFVDNDGFVVANLAYTPLEVISVKDQTLGITYEYGKDYTVDKTNKRLIIPLRTSDIPVIATDADINPANAPAGYQQVTNKGDVFVGYYVLDNGAGGKVVYTESSYFYVKYLSITYKYQREEVDRDAMSRYDKTKLTNLRAKLERGENIDMLVLGDSITAGCSTTGSYLTNSSNANAYFGQPVLPGTLGYAEQVAAELEKIYGVKVNLTNLAVGGALSDYSLVEYDQYNGRVGGYDAFMSALNAKKTYDLCIIGFGMNDSGAYNQSFATVFGDGYLKEIKRDAADPDNQERNLIGQNKDFFNRNITSYVWAIQGKIDIVPFDGDKVNGKAKYYDSEDRASTQGRSPDCDFIFVNTYPRNPVYDSWDSMNTPTNANNHFKQFKAELDKVAANQAPGSVVVDMYKAADSLLSTNLGVSKQNGTKRYCELSSTNLNHPNDYMHRFYAMNIVNTIYDYSDENFPILYKAHLVGNSNTEYTLTNDVYNYAYGANGWADYKQTNDVVYVDKNGDIDINQTYGYINKIDYGNVAQFNIQNSGWMINYFGYNVNNTIEFRFHVTAPGYKDSFTNNVATGKTSFAFAFSSSVMDALKTSNNMFSADIEDNKSKIGMWSANCSTANHMQCDLYGRFFIPQTGAWLGGNANGTTPYLKYKTETERIAANPGIRDEGFTTVRVNIGETKTLLSLVDRVQTEHDGIKYFKETVLCTTEIPNVTRADFPEGLAYLSFAVIDFDEKGDYSYGSAVVSFEDTRYMPVIADGAAQKFFPAYSMTGGWAMLEQGGGGYVNTGNAYTNYMGQPVIIKDSGNYGFDVRQDGTIHSAGTHWNLRAYDVNQPINIAYSYTYSPDTTVSEGWYAIQLWDNIENMLSDNLPWRDAFSPSKIHITGGNYVNYGIVNVGNGLNFFPNYSHDGTNSQPMAKIGNVINTSYGWGIYSGNPFDKIFININIVIGETETVITVNNNPERQVTLPVKRSDFAFGKAYMSVAISNEESSKSFGLKMWDLDRGADITDGDGTSGNKFTLKPDENGWDTNVQNTTKTWTGLKNNVRVDNKYGITAAYSGKFMSGSTQAGTYGYSQLWIPASGGTVNVKPFDVTEAIDLEYQITAPKVHSGTVSWYTISFFDDIDKALTAGITTANMKNTSQAFLTFLSANGRTFNFAGEGIPDVYGGVLENYIIVNPYTANHRPIETKYGFDGTRDWSKTIRLRISVEPTRTRIFVVDTGAIHIIEGIGRNKINGDNLYAFIKVATVSDNQGTGGGMAINMNLSQKYVPKYTNKGYDKHLFRYGLTLDDGRHDANNSTADLNDGTGDSAFITSGSYVVNKTDFDKTKEFEIKLNVGSGNWEPSQYGAWLFGFFGRRQHMHDVGNELWNMAENNDKVKLVVGGSSAQANGKVPNTGAADQHAYLRNSIYAKTTEINVQDTISNRVDGFDYIGYDGFVGPENGKIESGVRYVTLHIYIPEEGRKDQGYIKADGKLILSGPEMGVTQDDFPTDRVYLSFYSFGLTRWRLNIKQYEPTVVTSGLNLATDVSVNYRVQLGERYTNPVIDYNYTYYAYGADQAMQGTMTEYTLDNQDKYLFNFNELGVLHMSIDYNIKLKATNKVSGEQEVLYEVNDYSMRDYAEALLKLYPYAQNKKLVPLVVDLLNYASEAQLFQYRNAIAGGTTAEEAAKLYRTADLANKNIDAYQQYATKFVAPTTTKKATYTGDTVTQWRAQLWFGNEIGIHTQFQLAEGVDTSNLFIRIYVDGSRVETIPLADLETTTTNSGRVIYNVKHMLPASKFDKIVGIRMYNGDTNTEQKLTYSVNSWVYAAHEGENAAFAKAIWCFGRSSEVYLGA